MITFTGVNDVASTSDTLGQLRGLGWSIPGVDAAASYIKEAYAATQEAEKSAADAATTTAESSGGWSALKRLIGWGDEPAPAPAPAPTEGGKIQADLPPKPAVAVPLYKKPWFWAAVGGGAVVLGTGSYFLLRSKKTSTSS
jgi:hypothetical protein